jgi:hypothetical protein
MGANGALRLQISHFMETRIKNTLGCAGRSCRACVTRVAAHDAAPLRRSSQHSSFSLATTTCCVATVAFLRSLSLRALRRALQHSSFSPSPPATLGRLQLTPTSPAVPFASLAQLPSPLPPYLPPLPFPLPPSLPPPLHPPLPPPLLPPLPPASFLCECCFLRLLFADGARGGHPSRWPLRPGPTVPSAWPSLARPRAEVRGSQARADEQRWPWLPHRCLQLVLVARLAWRPSSSPTSLHAGAPGSLASVFLC